MILLLLSAGLLYYVWKKGVDFFFLAAGACVLYFYPIIFFDEVFFISEGVHHLIPVELAARASIVFGIFFLLVIGLFVSPVRYPVVSYTSRVKFYANAISFVVFLMMILVVYDNGLGLQGREKEEVMENLGYFYKLYSISGLVLISMAFATMKPMLLIFAVAVALFDLLFGFRAGVAELFAIYLLTRSPRRGLKNILFLLFGLLGLIILVLIKETSYFYNDISVDSFLALYDSEGLKFLSAVNIESASISAVYNQIIAHNFSISPIYLADCFFSIFPFLNQLGYQSVGFADYFKGVIFGSEGDSFASGMLAVSYAIASYFGVAMSFVGLALWGYVYGRFSSTKMLLLRVALTAISAFLLISFFRSDLLFLIGVVRSVVLASIALYLFYRFVKYFSHCAAPDFSGHGFGVKPCQEKGAWNAE